MSSRASDVKGSISRSASEKPWVIHPNSITLASVICDTGPKTCKNRIRKRLCWTMMLYFYVNTYNYSFKKFWYLLDTILFVNKGYMYKGGSRYFSRTVSYSELSWVFFFFPAVFFGQIDSGWIHKIIWSCDLLNPSRQALSDALFAGRAVAELILNTVRNYWQPHV